MGFDLSGALAGLSFGSSNPGLKLLEDVSAHKDPIEG
jgi:hypothetical protein